MQTFHGLVISFCRNAYGIVCKITQTFDKEMIEPIQMLNQQMQMTQSTMTDFSKIKQTHFIPFNERAQIQRMYPFIANVTFDCLSIEISNYMEFLVSLRPHKQFVVLLFIRTPF